MNKNIKKECPKNKETLQMICEVKKLYKEDFKDWEACYKELVKAVFKEEEESKYTKKEFLDWLDDDFIKQYPIFKYFKDKPSNVFSFIVMFNKYGVKSRQEIAKKILNEECNTDFYGVPSGQQGMSYNTFEKISDNDDYLNELAWKLIHSEDKVGNQKTLSDTFKNVFYILAPKRYYPSDKNTKAILMEIGKKAEPLSIEITEGDYFSRALSFVAPLEENQVDNILNKFINNNEKKPKNIILTGIPGTGKTYAVEEYLKKNKDTLGGYEFVQFHPSYDYEDFIEGFKPVASTNGNIEFKLVNGIFKELCQKACKNSTQTYIMVIDEINRANLSRVFGELLYCLEYRDKFVSTKMTTYIQSLEKEEQRLYSVSQETTNIGKFAIPSNVIILGTMNEVDRSIDAFDLALRRRFIWEEIGFSEKALRLYKEFFSKKFQKNIEDLLKKAKKLNKELNADIGVNYQLGHTYFYKVVDYFDEKEDNYDDALCNLWEYHLKSIVKEYLKIKHGEDGLEDKLEKYKEIVVGENNNCGK